MRHLTCEFSKLRKERDTAWKHVGELQEQNHLLRARQRDLEEQNSLLSRLLRDQVERAQENCLATATVAAAAAVANVQHHHPQPLSHAHHSQHQPHRQQEQQHQPLHQLQPAPQQQHQQEYRQRGRVEAPFGRAPLGALSLNSLNLVPPAEAAAALLAAAADMKGLGMPKVPHTGVDIW